MAGTKLVRDMSYRAHDKLFMALRPDTPGRDWKALADLMGYTYEQIKNFECERHPVKALINHWEVENKTISELMDFLAQIERNDLLEDLKPFIEETPTPEEAQQKLQEARCLTPSQRTEEATMDQKYDALLVYADEDQSFAEQLVSILEAAPYNLKICIEYRDMVPGGCQFEKFAVIIEKVCRKIILILSKNFTELRDGKPIFQAKLALSLSPGAKERCLIPVLYERCEVPTIYSHITHLDYTREDTRKFFWDRLSKSLKADSLSTILPSVSPTESNSDNSKQSAGKKVEDHGACKV